MFKTNKITTKSYVIIFSLFAFIIFIYHFSVYTLYTSKVLNVQEPLYVGDLVRLSYQVDFIDLKQTENTLQKKHIEAGEYKSQRVDILTIGDSFSNGGGGGKNAFYQDYISSIYNYNVLNIRSLASAGGRAPNSLLALEQSGILDEIKPKIIILSLGSRDIVRRLSNKLNFEQDISKNTILNEMKTMLPHELSKYQSKNISIVNTANFKLPFYTLAYKFRPCIKSVCKLPINKELFSINDKNHILVYKQTIKDLHMNTKENIIKVNNNLNKISKLLAKKGIKFIFMPAVSKYDLYSKFIKDNPFPKDILFEILKSLPKDYILINTKKILSSLLENGEKDIFYADDTHWSYKASKEIIEKTNFIDIKKKSKPNRKIR